MKFKKAIQKTIGFYFNILAYVNPKMLQRKGFALFCTPFAHKIKPHQMQFLEKGIAEVFEYENYKIQTYKWGNGSNKILLVHGWASHSFRWKKYVEQLVQQDFTVYALDAPAHGLSSGKMIHVVLYAQVIALFLQKKPDVTAIVSHSIGGFASTYYLDHYSPHNIEKVVIMGAPGEASDFFDFYKKKLGLSSKALNIIIKEFELQLGQLPSYFSTAKFAEHLTIQALIVHDKEDEEAHHHYSIRLNKYWKNSQLVLTEGLGHDLKSKEVIQLVINFLSSGPK